MGKPDDTSSGNLEESQETYVADQRVHLRRKLVVEVGLETPHRFWSGWSENISEGGIFVATEELLDVGEEVLVNLKVKGQTGARAFQCEVRWTRPVAEGDIPAGMGLKFQKLTAEEAKRIQEYIATEDIEVLIWDYDVLG